jgi:hypothetical protein
MPDVTLTVVRNPDPRVNAMLRCSQLGPPRPLSTSSDGDVNLLCGDCGFVICEGLKNAARARGVLLQCPQCKEFNASRF